MFSFKQKLVNLIPNIKLTMRMPIGGKVRYRARTDKGFLFRGMYRFEHEMAIFDCYKTYLQEGMTVFDIGANIGSHTIPLAYRVGTSGRVVAFEPDTDNLALLHENVVLNHLQQIVTVVPKAVSKEASKTQFWRDLYGGATGSLIPQDGNSGYHKWYGLPPCTIEVETISVDEFLNIEKGVPDLIKIDVEGAEAEVVEGMLGLLRNYSPKIIMDGAVQQAIELLRDIGYQIYDLMANGRCVAENEPPPPTFLAARNSSRGFKISPYSNGG